MALLESATIQCPCCWEPIEIVVDCSVPEQCYVEDCEVCCRPMQLYIEVGPDGLPRIEPLPANE